MSSFPSAQLSEAFLSGVLSLNIQKAFAAEIRSRSSIQNVRIPQRKLPKSLHTESWS